MKRGGVGGGNTITGIKFEGRTDIINHLHNLPGYKAESNGIGFDIYYEGKLVAHFYKQRRLYKYLDTQGVDWSQIFSKQLWPDGVIIVPATKTVYILEMKYQQGGGSVDEKLQTGDFKKKQYQKLFKSLGYKVEFIFILSEWFKHPRYKDSFDYVKATGGRYHFDFLPLHEVGLPSPTLKK